MSDATKVTPKQPGLTQSKKAKALLIALANLNLIFALVVFKQADPQIAGQMITAVLFLSGLYMGTQGSIDFANSWKSDTSTTKNTDEKITKAYIYQMQYADKK